MLTSTIVFAFAAAFVTAAPTSDALIARAGGPTAKPIPSSCAVTYPIPALGSQGYLPAPATTSAQFYGVYYPSPSSNKTALSQQCLEQCYGYGDSTECKAAYWAENVEVPSTYYNTPPGTYMTACLFYNRALAAADLVTAPAGNGTTPFAADIKC